MIDHLDKQTQPMDLEQKRGRGRPATGQALSNAERQRLYRERQKAQRNENTKGEVAWEDARALMAKIDELSADLAKALERAEEAEEGVKNWKNLAGAAERARQAVAIELAQRNEKEITDGKLPGTWVVEWKERRTKSWKKSAGVPESSWDAAKGSVDYMQFTSGTGQDDNWRARCTDGTFKGMIYWPKAPK